MTTRLIHALETSDGSATLYLSGVLSASDVFPLRRLCREIPARARVLRLDLNGVTRVEEGGMDAVRAVIRYWRETRQGSFRLSFSSEHATATIGVGDLPSQIQPADTPLPHIAHGSPALMGMFL